MRRCIFIASFASFSMTAAAFAGVTAFTAAGDAASIQAAVNDFRTSLGALNGNVPGSFGGGRREINWDAVPDAQSSPNVFAPDFFNGTTPGRARGALLATTGDHLEVSAKTGNPTNTLVEFGNVNPSYILAFNAFSPQKLFAPVGGEGLETTTTFFVPGTVTVPAASKGFGVIFTDVDLAGSTIVRCYDASDALIGEMEAPAAAGDGLFSFVGITMTGPERIAKVVITTGTVPLSPLNFDDPGSGYDVVAMDDFIYGEPISLNCPTDLNGDGTTDGADLGIFLAVWGEQVAHPADFNGDGLVWGADLGVMLSSWGPCVE